MDESLEGDTELPGFTLPGETSQEPIAGLENPAAQLAGVSYQVPDTIEWEQQNQGLGKRKSPFFPYPHGGHVSCSSLCMGHPVVLVASWVGLQALSLNTEQEHF